MYSDTFFFYFVFSRLKIRNYFPVFRISFLPSENSPHESEHLSLWSLAQCRWKTTLRKRSSSHMIVWISSRNVQIWNFSWSIFLRNFFSCIIFTSGWYILKMDYSQTWKSFESWSHADNILYKFSFLYQFSIFAITYLSAVSFALEECYWRTSHVKLFLNITNLISSIIANES